jgi:hypothetical protein
MEHPHQIHIVFHRRFSQPVDPRVKRVAIVARDAIQQPDRLYGTSLLKNLNADAAVGCGLALSE